MDETTRSLTFKAFGLLIAAASVELFVMHVAIAASHTAQALPVEPLARIEAPAASGRQCTDLDSFGNPIRPCRA